MPYFTEAELRDLPQMSDTTKYTTARITAAQNWIESLIELKVGTSFIARSVTETLSGSDQLNGGLKLSNPFVLSLTSITQNGVAFTAPQLAEVSFKHGILERYSSGSYHPTSWTLGRRNIVVAYSSGYSATPPANIKEAALTAARDWLLRRYQQQGVSDRAVSMQTEMGNITYASASDKHDRPTGIPDVDAVIMGWAHDLNAHGFA